MAIRIHYGVHTFETAEDDATRLRGELWKGLSAGVSAASLWRVKTDDGELHLLVTRDIPIAIVEYEKPVEFEGIL